MKRMICRSTGKESQPMYCGFSVQIRYTIRNALEKIINCQANRLAADLRLSGETPAGADPAGESLADEALMTLTEADVREGLGVL